MAANLIWLRQKAGSSSNMALKSYSCGCGCRFRVSDSEGITKCLTCRIVDDLKAGRLQPPAAIRLPTDSPAMVVGGGHV
jgi:hypothetical protein